MRILFGSQTGTAQMMAEEIEDDARAMSIESSVTDLQDMEPKVRHFGSSACVFGWQTDNRVNPETIGILRTHTYCTHTPYNTFLS